MTSINFEVDRNDLSRTRFTDIPDPEELDPGRDGVIIRVDRFALTANNITYGVAGDMIGYWKFFPASPPWGRIPVWGMGTVIQGDVTGLTIGDRCYGYFPMSSYLLVNPDNITGRGFADASEHRQELPPTYNQYSMVTPDNGFEPNLDNHQMLYRPLFTTAFVLDDFLEDNGYFGAEQVIVSSASSKTAFSLACLLHQSQKIQVRGLTSSKNADFVRSLGIYHDVVTYENITTMDRRLATAYVDMAGNRQVLEKLHHHYGDKMKYSCGVGITHRDAREGQDPSTLPGARPAMFFAPSQIQKRTAEWGARTFQKKLASAWTDFTGIVDQWVQIEESAGREELERVYQEVLAGAPPDTGYILSLQDDRQV